MPTRSPQSNRLGTRDRNAGSLPDPTLSLPSFDYHPHPQIIFGPNSIERVGELARALAGEKVLLVTDAGIVAAGHVERVRQNLVSAGLKVAVYDRVHENPTTRDVAHCVEVAAKERINLFVGLGGGSAMDTAKGCNFILTNGGRMQDYWGVGKATKPMLPLIAIPTTAGTGSECQSAALISDEETHQKMACLDLKAAAKIAILDPLLTVSQPGRVTACTGIDAIAHAVESAVTTKRTPLSSLYAREAFRLTVEAFPLVLKTPTDVNARARMQLGAAFAGTAIENSMLGAAHSAANPLTAHYGIVHGHAVGLMLPHVVRFNAIDSAAGAIYRELFGSAEKLARLLEKYLKQAGLPASLAVCGVKRSKIPSLAEEAANQWTARFNPRSITKKDFIGLYQAAFEA